MTKRKSPEREWQQQLIDDYYDYRWLVNVIQLDGDWFDAWLEKHPAPPGVRLVPRAVRE